MSKELNKKQKELKKKIKESLLIDSIEEDELIENIIKIFGRIEPPEKSMGMGYAILGKSGDGYSVKPGNILLNWKKLFKSIPEIVLNSTSAKEGWHIVLIALIVWNEVWSLLKIDLSEDHAIVLLVLWENRDKNRKIEQEKAFGHVNKYLTENDKSNYTKNEFAQVVDDLIRLQCIKLTDGVVWLREWVQKSYE